MSNCQCLCFSLLCFVIVSLLFSSNDYNRHIIQKSAHIYPVNISKQYNKEVLNDIVQKEVIKIVDTTVYSITRDVINVANHGHTKYQWKDDRYVLNNNMYEQVIEKIMVIFPDIKMEEFDGYTIRFDWS
jgi:hypothetical protein